MDSLKTILVPLDGSELAKQALPYAAGLAGPEGHIALLTVTSLPSQLTEIGFVHPEGATDATVKQAAQESLRKTAEEFTEIFPSGVEVELLVSEGDPASEILAAADAIGADLIVMTSHARGAIGRAAFGSIADRITRTSAIPIVIIRPHDRPKSGAIESFRRIVLPLDGSALATNAVPVAKAIAHRLELLVWIVRAVNLKPSFFGEGTLPLPESIASERRAKAQAELEAVARDLQDEGLEASVDVLTGAPFSAIAAAVDADDLIVMTSHGRSGFNRWLLGSVADKLVRMGPAPVCLVPTRAATSA